MLIVRFGNSITSVVGLNRERKPRGPNNLMISLRFAISQKSRRKPIGFRSMETRKDTGDDPPTSSHRLENSFGSMRGGRLNNGLNW